MTGGVTMTWMTKPSGILHCFTDIESEMMRPLQNQRWDPIIANFSAARRFAEEMSSSSLTVKSHVFSLNKRYNYRYQGFFDYLLIKWWHAQLTFDRISWRGLQLGFPVCGWSLTLNLRRLLWSGFRVGRDNTAALDTYCPARRTFQRGCRLALWSPPFR